MTEARQTVWYCDGYCDECPRDSASYRGCKQSVAPHMRGVLGWCTLDIFGGPKHLCPHCATQEQVGRLMDHAQMARLDRERGD